MVTKLSIIANTILKQEPIDSSKLAPEKKHGIEAGKELELQSWTTAQHSHIKVVLANPINGKNTWLAFSDHVKILQNDNIVLLETSRTTSVMVKNYTSCSTKGLKGLDRQIIAEMNEIDPNCLVSFEDLNVECGPAVWAYLQLPAKKALAKAIAERGRPMFVNSAYRTIAQQQVLFNHFKAGNCGIAIAAVPPTSNHQSGLAIDINEPNAWKPFLEKHGWKHLGPSDPPHFDFKGSGTRDIRKLAVLAFQRVWNEHNLNDQIEAEGDFGPETQKRLNNSFVEGFGISIAGFRVLRLTQPLMQGEDVRKVQQALLSQGYSLGELGADELYGLVTENAVKKFQQDKGLVVDGLVGPTTREKLGL
ncbi:MAG: peptidoglycan-binding protein [Coleofasciculus sp. S288]|nr:peptidoglycan-binding protein [Coleofasciculus sp. S288]